MRSALKDNLESLQNRIDALWVPNDSIIVNPELLQSIWFPFTARFRKPIIVGVEVLVNPRLNFGMFAVIPDAVHLGEQAAEMVFEIMDEDWKITGPKVAPPRSVYKIINLKQAKRLFHVDQNAIWNIVDKVLR